MTAFVALVDAGSFSGAAARLGLTPSAMSKLIARLEESLGARLVQRTTRTMQVTEVGRSYAEHARRILEDIDAVEREIESSDPRPKGTLRVTAPSILGHVRVLPVVIAFQQENPEVTVHLHLTDHVVDLVEDQIDVAIRMTSAPPPSFVARKLGEDTRVLCASPGYLTRRGKPRAPEDLPAHDCILFTAGQSATGWRFRASPQDDRVQLVHVKGRLTASNTFSVRDAALAGCGIADLPRYLVEKDLQAGTLVSLLPRYVLNERSVYALYAPSRFVAPKVRKFVDALTDGLAHSAKRERARGTP
jgi:DNA-binding transcriptional LysR family regulator